MSHRVSKPKHIPSLIVIGGSSLVNEIGEHDFVPQDCTFGNGADSYRVYVPRVREGRTQFELAYQYGLNEQDRFIA